MSLSVFAWEVPFQLSVPLGTLDFNVDVALSSGNTGQFLLNPASCEALIPLRVRDDNIPQADGEIIHERFFQGYLMTLAVQLWTGDTPACDDDLAEMADMLMYYWRNIPRGGFTDAVEGRIYWTPDGADQRMIRRIAPEAALTWDLAGPLVEATFQVKSPYPYAWDAAEIQSALPATLTNTGTADFWPVIKVFGAPSANFTITNTSVLDNEGNPLSIVYDTGTPIPGGGQYVEIDTFRNTMYLNGNGANMKDGLNVLQSDFFPLAVGANNITISGATATVLWQSAWG